MQTAQLYNPSCTNYTNNKNLIQNNFKRNTTWNQYNLPSILFSGRKLMIFTIEYVAG